MDALVGREVLHGWDGKVRGTIVGSHVDRGEMFVVIEEPTNPPSEGRTQLMVEPVRAIILKALTPKDPALDPSKVWDTCPKCSRICYLHVNEYHYMEGRCPDCGETWIPENNGV